MVRVNNWVIVRKRVGVRHVVVRVRVMQCLPN